MGRNNIESIIESEKDYKKDGLIKTRFDKFCAYLELFSYGAGYTGVMTLCASHAFPPYYPLLVNSSLLLLGVAASAWISSDVLYNYEKPKNRELKINYSTLGKQNEK